MKMAVGKQDPSETTVNNIAECGTRLPSPPPSPPPPPLGKEGPNISFIITFFFFKSTVSL